MPETLTVAYPLQVAVAVGFFWAVVAMGILVLPVAARKRNEL